MARRSRGDGAVYYDPDRDRWVGAIDLGRDPQTGRRVRRKVSAETKSAAREKLDALRDEKRRTGTVGRRDVTVEQVVRDMLANPPEAWRSPNTIEANTDHANRVVAELGRVRLARLTVAQVEGLLRGMAKSGYSRRTIASTRSVLARSIRRAEREGVITRNVADLAEMPSAATRASGAMSLEQVGALLTLDGLGGWWRAYIATGVMLGLRPGELAGLRWEDVDLDAGLLRVRHSLKRAIENGTHRLEVGDLKTQQSRRTLRMPAPARSALAAWRREQAAARLRLGAAYTDHGLVFAGESGQPRWPQVVRGEFGQLCERAGIGSRWQLRELRHTFVSQMSAAGVDLEVIADHVGHVNSNVTRGVYRHQLADEVGAAAAVFDKLYGATS